MPEISSIERQEDGFDQDPRTASSPCRAPLSALRTPISRGGAVDRVSTMIAITPMPGPNYQAIEEITSSAMKVSCATPSHTFSAVLRLEVDVDLHLELQVVADAHHRFHSAHRLHAHAVLFGMMIYHCRAE